MVLFDLLLLGFVGCVERKYDEDNYPMVMEVGSDVVDNQDVFEGEDTTEEEEVAEIDDTGDPMDPEDLEQLSINNKIKVYHSFRDSELQEKYISGTDITIKDYEGLVA